MTTKDYIAIQNVILDLAKNKNNSWIGHSDKNVGVAATLILGELTYQLTEVFSQDNERYSHQQFEAPIFTAIDNLR